MSQSSLHSGSLLNKVLLFNLFVPFAAKCVWDAILKTRLELDLRAASIDLNEDLLMSRIGFFLDVLAEVFRH